MKIFKLTFIIVITLVLFFGMDQNIDAQFWGQIAPPEFSVSGDTTVGGFCSSGYELVSFIDHQYAQLSGGDGSIFTCERLDLCDQYGNGWPRLELDTEVDGSFTLCGATEAANVTATLGANPGSVYNGQQSTLTWNSANATSCSGNGFLTGGSTSGSIAVSPNATTNYSVTCNGPTGIAMDSAEVIFEGGIDLVPAKPSLNSGSLNGGGKTVTFKSSIINTGTGNVTESIPTRFELDIGNDGTYDVTLTSNSLAGLNGGESKGITSSNWSTILGTHAVRAIVDTGEVTPLIRDDSGCYTVQPDVWSEQIGTEGCSTSGGANGCGLYFDPQSLYATIGGYGGTEPITVCPDTGFCFDSGIGGETGSFNELRQPNMEGTICTSNATPTTFRGCTSIFVGSGPSAFYGSGIGIDLCLDGIGGGYDKGKAIFTGKQKDFMAKYGSIVTQDMQAHGGVSIRNADMYTGKKTGGGGATLTHLCELIDPNAKATNYKSRKYNSPGNNSIVLWNGTSWERHGAKRYNSHVSGPFTCTSYEPGDSGSVVTPGELPEENEANNFSEPFIFTITQPQCSDGIDNDNDGDIDYPADSDCSGGGDAREGATAQCADGIDNDGDGLIDLSDGGCSGIGDNNETNEPDAAVLPQVDIFTIPAVPLVRKGTEVTVVWTATNVNSCVVSGPSISKAYSSESVSDQSDVEIEARSVYTISCDTVNGTVTDSVSIGVVPSFIEE